VVDSWVSYSLSESRGAGSSKHRAPTIQMRVMNFIADDLLGGRAAGMALEAAGEA
jgi:hypothetical protein